MDWIRSSWRMTTGPLEAAEDEVAVTAGVGLAVWDRYSTRPAGSRPDAAPRRPSRGRARLPPSDHGLDGYPMSYQPPVRPLPRRRTRPSAPCGWRSD
ncbi:hypothetical protein [Lysobacter gummosus]|uniref:hypothetical protein n=1 Tax=Lysobacter gummosus TaxID=262324 RepID=UPI00363EA558